MFISLWGDSSWSVGFYHAGLAQSILHHQHLLQAQSCARLQLLVGDFQGRGRHPGQGLEEETQGVLLDEGNSAHCQTKLQ